MLPTVQPNASSLLTRARQTGDTTYDPTTAVTLYTDQARNEVVYSTFLKPALSSTLRSLLGAFATSSAQKYVFSSLLFFQPPKTKDMNTKIYRFQF